MAIPAKYDVRKRERERERESEIKKERKREADIKQPFALSTSIIICNIYMVIHGEREKLR